MDARDRYRQMLVEVAKDVATAEDAASAKRTERDELIRRAAAAGLSERSIAACAKVSRGWVYQVRRRHCVE